MADLRSNQVPAASGASLYPARNVIIVDPASPVVAGKSYQTIPDAETYAQTLTPSVTNPILIELAGGFISDILTQKPYVAYRGNNTRLTGQIHSAIGFGDIAAVPYSFIENCIMENITGSSTFLNLFKNSTINGGTYVGVGFIALHCLILDGDFSAVSFATLNHCDIPSFAETSLDINDATFLNTTIEGGGVYTLCSFKQSSINSCTLDGLIVESGSIGSGVTFANNGSTINIANSKLQKDISISSGTIILSHVSGFQSITLTGTATLEKYNSPTISVNGGTGLQYTENFSADSDGSTIGWTATSAPTTIVTSISAQRRSRMIILDMYIETDAVTNLTAMEIDIDAEFAETFVKPYVVNNLVTQIAASSCYSISPSGAPLSLGCMAQVSDLTIRAGFPSVTASNLYIKIQVQYQVLENVSIGE